MGQRSPSCNCCTCQLHFDGTDYASHWNEDSGTWNYAGDLTASASGLLRYSKTYGGAQWVRFDTRSSAAGNTASIHLHANASGEGIEVRITFGTNGSTCGTVDILDKDGNSLLPSGYYCADIAYHRDLTASSTRWHRVTACMSDERLLVQVLPGEQFASTPLPLSLAVDLSSLTQAGSELALSAVVSSGTVDFKNFNWFREIASGAECKNCDPCDTDSAMMLIGGWLAPDPIAAAKCDEIRDDDNIDDVQLKNVVLTEWDREHGYTILFQGGITWQTVGESVTVILDGGQHKAEFKLVEADTPYPASSPTPLPIKGLAIRVSLTRGATTLATRDIWFGENDIFDTSSDYQQMWASLKGDRFSCGINNGHVGDGDTALFGIVHGRRPFLEATTTSTHNGCYVGFVVDNTISQHSNQAELLYAWRCSYFPDCVSCDDVGHVEVFSLTLPEFTWEGASGTLTCGAGTRILRYVENCTWEHVTDEDHVVLGIETVGTQYRYVATVHVCGHDPLTYTNHRVYGDKVFRSALVSSLDCVGADAVELVFDGDYSKIATLTAV